MIPSGMKFPNGKMAKGKGKKTVFRLFILMLALITLLILADELRASGDRQNCYHCTFNYGDGEQLTITNGMDESALAGALTQAYASGAHELDWSTTDLQLSFTYAIQIDGQEEDAYSFKAGQKELFGKNFLPSAMFHVTLNPEVEDLGNTIIFGGTVRIR